MKLKKVVAVSLTAVIAMGTLSGCKSESGVTASSSAASGTIQETTEKKKITVSVWDNDSTPQFSSVTAAFMADHPDVEVELIDTQSNEYKNKVTVMLAGGDSDPDVIFIKDTENQVTMKDKNQLLSLDEYIKKDQIDLDIYSGVAEQLQMDGANYTLPFRKDSYLLYYNKDIFDQAGVDYPSDDMTWEEYELLAREMTSGEGSSKIYGTHNHIWMALVGNWAIQDGVHTLMDEDYSFLKPYYEQAVRMQDDGIIQSYANLKTGNIHYISIFDQQQCAMIPMGSWFIGTLIQDRKDAKYDFNWGVTRLPHPEGVEAGSTMGSATPVAINAKSDEPDLAWEYIKFVTGEKGATVLAENGMLPAAESPVVIDTLANIEGFPEDGKIALSTTSWVFDRPIHEKMAAVRKVLEEEHDLIMIGEEDIDTGIENMNTRAKEARED